VHTQEVANNNDARNNQSAKPLPATNANTPPTPALLPHISLAQA